MRTLDFLRGNAPWLAAGATLTLMSSFGQTFFISVFSGEIRTEFGLSDGDWGLIYALGTLASAAVMIWAGGLTDHVRTGRLGLVVLAGLAASCLAMALNTSVAGLVLVVFLLRFFGQGMASHTAIVAMSRWFVATRGRALSVCSLGFTVGEAVLPLAFVALLAVFDWRLLWGVAALLVCLSLPALAFFLRSERDPRHDAARSETAGMGGLHWARGAVLKHPLFWCMVPALLGPSAFNTAFFFHQVRYAEAQGWSHLSLVSLFPVYTMASVAAMLISGRALDHFGTARLLPFYQLPMVGAFLVYGVADSTALVLLGLFCMALTTGANSTLPNAFWAEFYGTRHLGAVKAMATAIMVLGSALGPGITGIFLDSGVPLSTQYLGIAGYFGLTTFSMWVGIAAYRDALPLGRARRKYT